MTDKTIIPEVIPPEGEDRRRQQARPFTPAGRTSDRPGRSLAGDLRTFAGGLLVAAGVIAAIIFGGFLILTLVAVFGLAYLVSRLFSGFGRRGPGAATGALYRSVVVETARPGEQPRRVVRVSGRLPDGTRFEREETL